MDSQLSSYCFLISATIGKRGKCKPYIDSNQYSVTEHLRHLAPNSGRGLPGESMVN